MKFEDWVNANKGRKYSDLLQETFKFEDKDYFAKWAHDQRLGEFPGNDWGMLAISLLSQRIDALDKKKKDK